MLLILAAAAVSSVSAPDASAGNTGAAEESVIEARRLNPTSAELILSDGHRMTVDFYAPEVRDAVTVSPALEYRYMTIE